MEFKHEAFALFDELSHQLRSDIANDLFRFQIITEETAVFQKLMSQINMEQGRSFTSELEAAPQSPPEAAQTKAAPVVVEPKVRRNDPCPCGSGKKYKKCCGASEEE